MAGPKDDAADLRGPQWSMVKNQQLVRRQREFGVGPAVIVRELNLANAIQHLDDGANLPAQETVGRHIYQESDDIQ